MRSTLPLVLLLLGACDLVTGLPRNFNNSSTDRSLHGSFLPGIFHGLANKISNLLSKNEIWTPFGPIKGIETDRQGVIRYVVRYATADQRWAEARPTEWGIESLNELPPICPQTPSTILPAGTPQSEDCLYLTIYRPPRKLFQPKLPVFFWIHGGSHVAGGSRQPGLDGSGLAAYGRGMIVVVAQYRLGVLGLLPPTSTSTSDPNLSLLDLKSALRFTRRLIPSLGGDAEKITIAGHSSGGQMVRALLASPDMRGSFRGAIIQSDPMAFGFSTSTLTKTLQDQFYGQKSYLDDIALISCPVEDMACWRHMNVGRLLRPQEKFLMYMAGEGSIAGVPAFEVLRPTASTASLQTDSGGLTSADQISHLVPLLLTTVQSEAGALVQSLFPDPIDDPAIAQAALQGLLGAENAQTLSDIPEYDLANRTSMDKLKLPGVDEIRSTLVRVLTDGVWRCPSRDFAERRTKAGGRDVWVGEWSKGKKYPSNEGGSICQSVVVCHEDELFTTFGQGDPNLVDEAHSYWSAFVHDLDPGGGWQRYTGSVDSVHPIGGETIATTCPAVWGNKVQYDWQLYS